MLRGPSPAAEMRLAGGSPSVGAHGRNRGEGTLPASPSLEPGATACLTLADVEPTSGGGAHPGLGECL